MRTLRDWIFGSLILVALCFLCGAAFGATWYITPSGGTRYSSAEPYGMCNGQSNAAYPGLTTQTWASSHAYTLSAKIIDDNGDYETVTTAGTSAVAASRPTWPANGSSGSTTTDGTVTWTSGGVALYNQACPFRDVRYLWADGSYNASGTFPGWGWVIAGGDTVLISGCIQYSSPNVAIPGSSGSCRIGYSGPNSGDYFLGLAGAPNGSGPLSIPSGTAGAHTKIYGVNYAACTSAAAKTSINGGYGAGHAFALSGSAYVDIACLDITDHSSCGRSGTSNLCQTGFPLDDYANDGIDWSNTTTNSTVTDVNIHGMAASGMAGPTGDGVTVTRVAVTGNSSSGWNMDAGDSTTGTGHLTLSYFATIFNGCAETYPITTTITVPNYTLNGGTIGSVNNCFDDSSGGYGDGIGTATVQSSPAWLMTLDHSLAAWNTQDGFDLLHLQGGGTTLTATNNIAYGNMGQQLKVGAAGIVYNNYLVGNCNALRQAIPGTPAGYNTHLSDFCRAGDAAAVLSVQDGATSRFQFNTIVTAGSVALEVPVNGTCSTAGGSTCLLQYENNVMLGFTNNTANGYPGGGTGNNPQPIYFDTTNPLPNAGSAFQNNSTYGQKSSIACPEAGETNAQCGNPGLVDETWHLYDTGNAAPAVTNALAGHGVTVSGITTDINGASRANPPTIGAYEVVVPPAIPVGGGTINGRIANLIINCPSKPNTCPDCLVFNPLTCSMKVVLK